MSAADIIEKMGWSEASILFLLDQFLEEENLHEKWENFLDKKAWAERKETGVLSEEDVVEEVAANLPDDANDFETDNEGQLVIYTGIYRHKDGTYHTEAEE